MNFKTLALGICTLSLIATSANALPDAMTAEELEAGATLIVTAEVSATECVGTPVVTTDADNASTVTVTNYRSTLTVTSSIKGEAPELVFIDGSTTDYSDMENAPVGGWTQPAYGVGTSGTFHLIAAADDAEGFTLVWWNGLEEDANTAPGDLPSCDEPDVPGTDFEPPNPCWKDSCPAEYAACGADPSCVAWNACQLLEGEEATACLEQVLADYPDLDPQANHPVYFALQECGWTNCNDPSSGTCVDRCGEWDDAWSCNCDDACAQYEDCCDDLEEVCGGTEPPPPPCVPVCDGIQCGSDSCGGECGTCETGSSCSKTGQCLEDEPEPPACEDACAEGELGCDGKTVWTCQQDADGCWQQLAGDACAGDCSEGVCGDVTDPTDPGTDTTSSSDDGGGCNSSTPGTTGGLLLLALVIVGLAVRRERVELV